MQRRKGAPFIAALTGRATGIATIAAQPGKKHSFPDCPAASDKKVVKPPSYSGYAFSMAEHPRNSYPISDSETDVSFGRDITILIYLEHARRRICNAVNVDFLADIATQTKATKLAASRFEEYSPQYLLYI